MTIVWRIVVVFFTAEQVYLEVCRVNTQTEGVQLTELQKTTDQVVDQVDGIDDALHHGVAMLPDVGGVGPEVCPVGEVHLGLGVDDDCAGDGDGGGRQGNFIYRALFIHKADSKCFT